MTFDPRDYVCMAVSPDGFICNGKPEHEGDHIATARPPGGDQYEAARWKNEDGDVTPRRLPHDSNKESK